MNSSRNWMILISTSVEKKKITWRTKTNSLSSLCSSEKCVTRSWSSQNVIWAAGVWWKAWHGTLLDAAPKVLTAKFDSKLATHCSLWSCKSNWNCCKASHTVQNLHFLSKNSTLISRENCQFFWGENSWKCCGFGLFSCWQHWFHEKNCQNNLGEKLVKMLGFCQSMNYWTKIWLS